MIARDLARSFAGKPALVDVDLTLQPGEIVGLLGHNGAGKTTAVRLLAGVLTRDGGSVRVFGLDPQVDGVAVRRRLGVSTETPAVDDRTTGRYGLSAYAALYDVPVRAVAQRVQALLTEFDLLGAADARVGTYSRGMRQRLALARALLHDPELLFLDEPTAGLDPVAARAVNDRIRALRDRGRGVLLCTHDLTQAQALCDRVLVLQQGRVVAGGAPRALAESLGAGARVRFAWADPAGAAALLRTRPGFADVTVRVDGGEGVARDDDAIADAVAALAAAGVRIHAVERDHATLEDVYFALHARGGVRA